MKKINYALLLFPVLTLYGCTTPSDIVSKKPSNQGQPNTPDNKSDNCGNGQLNYGEECDNTALGGATCTNLGLQYTSGTLGCNKNCTYNFDNCSDSKPKNCGDGKISKGEECDGENLNDRTCDDFGGYQPGVGTLSCYDTCRYDKSGCIPLATDTPESTDDPDEHTATSTCDGPAGYFIEGVQDGYPCNFDTDCEGSHSKCLSYGYQFNLCSGTTLGAAEAMDKYIIEGVSVDLFFPCIDDSDCGENSYCFWGETIALCLPTCVGTDRANPPYTCEKVYGHKDLTFACTLNGGGTGHTGDTCTAKEFDCLAGAICHNGQCSEPCGANNSCEPGFSCQYLTATGQGHCFANATLGKGKLGDSCIANAFCSSGLYCSNSLICSKNPNTISSNYKVSGLENGHPCNQNFDCKTGVCSAYYWDNASNADGDIYDYICGSYDNDNYTAYLNSTALAEDGQPCNYDEDCSNYDEEASCQEYDENDECLKYDEDRNYSSKCWWADDETLSSSMCVPTCYNGRDSGGNVIFKACPNGYYCNKNNYFCIPNQGLGVKDAPCKMSYWDCAQGFYCDTLSLTCQEDY